MKTSSRPREIVVAHASKREHAARISISDMNHHVTEAIGDLYGDDDYSNRDSQSTTTENIDQNEASSLEESYLDKRNSWTRSIVNGNGLPLRSLTSPITNTMQRNSFDAKNLPQSLSLREELPSTQFPLNDIDYESDPAEVAQALSNLQALRRLSMDVGSTNDPDLPSFQSASMMPSIAPTGNDNGDDPSRLFWVPARVHPELAPMEFKTFLENRVQSIKRQPGEQRSSTDIFNRTGTSEGPLQRKKSMLSRQVSSKTEQDFSNEIGTSGQVYRKSSLSQSISEPKGIDLNEIDALVRDPSKVMKKLTLDTKNIEGAGDYEDTPILPQAPEIGLRRSTRTTYRRGSLRKGERVPSSKRVGTLKTNADGETNSIQNEDKKSPAHIEPLEPDNFSHPSRVIRRLQSLSNSTPVTPTDGYETDSSIIKDGLVLNPSPKSTSSIESSQKARSGYSLSATDSCSDSSQRNYTIHTEKKFIPEIIETPPLEFQSYQTTEGHTGLYQDLSSRQTQTTSQTIKASSEPVTHQAKRPNSPNSQVPHTKVVSSPSTNEVLSQDSSILSNGAKTETTSTAPNFESKKNDKKLKKDKDETESLMSRKPTWNWFKGSDERERKEKKKEEDREGKKSKKGYAEKSHDTARLDVLQSTLDTGAYKPRESIFIDRESVEVKPLEDKRKENRKASGEKKEKDSIFSSIFGGSKRRGERDASGKKGTSLRTLSPEPPLRQLKPDVDYNWTRFSILEERAIYRMAHIKLANPRRALYSQVLLSNFMYSYLAKVQQMHPHMQIPQSALQKKQELERRQKEQEQQSAQQYSENGQYRYDYHQGIAQYAEGDHTNEKSERVNYVDDSQIYDYDHQEGNANQKQDFHRPESRASQHTAETLYENQDQYGRRDDEYYQFSDQHDDIDESDMW
ncbi:telomere silencing protein Zds1, putative [Blumeria hordei DH14]|uniref:Telomere silencing protein Zds1, putative n=1 Tax=Blumeria graminis f. sp. hordei (strain DH14) TaxID=546991 RepID=N1JIA6_BLUG1|nr:telomere silencing protein Zds1, putative [Blumeria hordei DH14]